jgi:hypothetical protein
MNLDSDTVYAVWPEADGSDFSSRSVETRRSRDNAAQSGNRWAVDFYAESGDGVINMGAYGAAEASKSHFGSAQGR